MTHSTQICRVVIALSALLAANGILYAQEPQLNVEHPLCSVAEAYDPGQDADGVLRREIALLSCRLPTHELNAAEIERRLAGERFAFDVSADEVTVFARQEARDQSVRSPLEPVQSQCARSNGAINACLEQREGSPYWAARYRMAYVNEALLTFYVFGESSVRLLQWRGPDAPSQATSKAELAGTLIDTELRSESLGETRRLTVYLPDGHDVNETYPAVFFADGNVLDIVARWVEPLIDEGRLPPIVLVGSLSGQPGVVEDRSELNTDLRAADYLPGFYRDRFDRHMSFFADELTRHAVETWSVSADPAKRAVHGRSNGGRFAFYAGYLRPDRFGNVLAMSNSARNFGPASPADSGSARFFIVSGRYEPTVIHGSRRAAEALRAAGYEVVHYDLSVGHTQEIDEVMLVPLLEQIFAGEPHGPSGL
jgi:enterochelin esterase-like enzyme